MNPNLEQSFLQALLDSQVDVHIFLSSGIKLVGKVGSFDDKCILLSNTISQIIYKTAISTVVPQGSLDYSKL